MWTDMEKNDEKAHELFDIINDLQEKIIYSGSKKQKRKKDLLKKEV